MRLIGMLDSPYVRRVAISLKAMDIPFEHVALSVFRDFGDFASINPTVKAPTLVVNNNLVLSDSTLILEYLNRVVAPDRRLLPANPEQFLTSQGVLGFALTACEKTVQVVYELNLRPEEKRYQPWLDRVEAQLLAAYNLLEASYSNCDGWMFNERLMQVDITAAVAWRFTQSVLPNLVQKARFPSLYSLSSRAEKTHEFMAASIA